MYLVRGRTTLTEATADDAIWQVWNPHPTQRVRVIAWAMCAQGGTLDQGWSSRLRRTSARGTATSTVTLTAEHHGRRGVAPPSGVLLDLRIFTVQPTLLAGDLAGFLVSEIQGAAVVSGPTDVVEIPPGTGLAMIQTAVTSAVQFEVTVALEEDG